MQRCAILPAVSGLRDADATTRLFEVVQDDRTTGLGTIAVVVKYADRGLLQLTEQSINSLLRDLTFPF